MSKNTSIPISKEALEKIQKNSDILMDTEGYWTIEQARDWTKKKNKL